MHLKVSNAVKSLYSNWLDRTNLRARSGQQEMMSFIESIISDQSGKVGVVEAPTGTGKTIAYAATAIPWARQTGKTVLIVTATVTLQEQIVTKDLPKLCEISEEPFSFTLAKGRRRFVCPQRLSALVARGSSPLAHKLSAAPQDFANFELLHREFVSGAWDGDTDSAPVEIPAARWPSITTDARGCHGPSCGMFSVCPYFDARQKIHNSDVVVTNYDHLLSNLVLDNGVFPPLEETIIIFDEAHHLPDKVSNAFTKSTEVNEIQQLMSKVNSILGDAVQRGLVTELSPNQVTAFQNLCVNAEFHLQQLTQELQDLQFSVTNEGEEVYCFFNHQIQESVQEPMVQLGSYLDGLGEVMTGVIHSLKEKQANGAEEYHRLDLTERINEFGNITTKIEKARELFWDYSEVESNGRPARWVERKSSVTPPIYRLNSVPIDTNVVIQHLIWNNVYKVICTSATLDAGDKFQHFIASTGLELEQPATLLIQSPFDLNKMVNLQLPNITESPEPKNMTAYVKEITLRLPKFLSQENSALVLFTSRKTMNEVYRGLDPIIKNDCYIQESGGVPTLLNEHRRRIDLGQRSYLLGLESLREGIDLPGVYCRHVIITRLPFSVPTDPICLFKKDLLSEQGVENTFEPLQLLPAILKLKQSCGRLIRNDDDWGRITFLDNRIVKRHFGKKILAALPDYGRN